MASSPSEKKHAAWVDVLAGGFGGTAAKALLSPFQRVVVLQQLGQHRQFGVLQLVQHIYRTDGLSGFWRGNLTSMIIRVPFSGVQFLVYGKTKFFLQDWLDQRSSRSQKAGGEANSFMEKFVMKCGAGGFSAMVAGAAVYPGEVVRLRLMSGEAQFKGIWGTCRAIYSETNSIRNFYRGLSASLIQRVPDILVSFATYETVKYSLLDDPSWSFLVPPPWRRNETARNVYATVIGGSMAALASILVAFPLDVAKRRIGMSGQGKDAEVYRGVVDCLRKVYRKEGWRGWYAGGAVEALRCVPQVVLMWFFIEGLQKQLSSMAHTLA